MRARHRLTMGLVLGLAGTIATVVAAPAAPASVASFRNFAHPSDVSNAGEPTLGVNRETNTVLYQSYTNTYAVTGFNARTGAAEWKTSNAILTSVTSLDPIIETDFETGRTFVSQLTGACSLMAYTDNDGRNWQEVPDGCGAGSVFDHQTVGTGAFVPGGTLRPATSYPRAVYYCSQAIVVTNCATSVDGGLTFLPAVNAWTSAGSGCTTIHGHVSSAPDGTVYLPPRSCRGGTGVAVSENNGLSWTIRQVPGSVAPQASNNAKDPSIAAGADGTAYLSWGQKVETDDAFNTVPHVAVTRDKGRTWTKPVALGQEFRVQNTKFISTVAGDGDRAAIAFLGTSTSGPDQLPTFEGVWRLYVAFTYDRGRTWRTVLATPESPVQVGRICDNSGSCAGTRNLLDFMDVTADAQGRVLVAFADGCLEKSCDTKSRFAAATISRQSTGRGLYRAFDTVVK
ncbi:MAG TPA: sialidase family protein [Mycobacteriales bacterium]|nr:sialidase family protein [Mycobacteriales bacterium]